MSANSVLLGFSVKSKTFCVLDNLAPVFRLILAIYYRKRYLLTYFCWLTHKMALKRKATIFLIKSEKQMQETIC